MSHDGYGMFNPKREEPPTGDQLKHKAPVLPPCENAGDLDCCGIANPAWRDNGRVFCRNCAPPRLKTPSLVLKDQSHD